MKLSSCARLALVTLLTLVAASSASAQGGYTSEKHPEFGFDFSRARDFIPVPTQPGEEWVVLYYVEEEAHREEDRKRFRPELRVAIVDRPQLEPETPQAVETPSPEASNEEEQPESLVVPITDFDSYAYREMRGWTVGQPEELKQRSGYEAQVCELQNESSTQFRGAAFSYDNGERTVIFYGFCLEDDFDDQLKIWTKMLSKIKFYEPEELDASKLERYYARRNFKNPEYRIQVRTQLVKGWEAEDTENYIIVYSTKDQPLIRIIKSELEAIREEYVRLFPPKREITAVSTVRICKDETEYRKYGGPAGSGGYWSAGTEELVFFDYENEDGEKGSGKANTRIVLYHEAFHQYIYYTVGQVAPHSWFNEGTGDFFSGALIKGGKVLKIGYNPWRFDLIQAVLKGITPFKKESFSNILGYSQAEFYSRNRVAVCYAQAWSMIYFLRTSKEARDNPVWSEILDIYFNTLQRTFSDAIAAKPDGELTEEELEEAKLAARNAALEQAFSDVDLIELERAWEKWVRELEPPR